MQDIHVVAHCRRVFDGCGKEAADEESERMDLMQGNSGAVKALGRQSSRGVDLENCGDNNAGEKLW